jgi:hypothetical protein
MFEETQPIRFLVLDVDDPKVKIDANSKGKDTIGWVETNLSDIVASKGSCVERVIVYEYHCILTIIIEMISILLERMVNYMSELLN